MYRKLTKIFISGSLKFKEYSLKTDENIKDPVGTERREYDRK